MLFSGLTWGLLSFSKQKSDLLRLVQETFSFEKQILQFFLMLVLN